MTTSKIVLVTGGTGALGRAIVDHFVEEGARVHVSWIVDEEAQTLAAAWEETISDPARRPILHRADVTDEGSVRELFGAIEAAEGRVDVVANIVGGFAFASLGDTDTPTWRRMLELNATSTFLCCREGAGLMKAKLREPEGSGQLGPGAGGRLINVGAMPAVGDGAANMSAYSASKAAVCNLTMSLAQELADSKITVNAIVPSIIDTPTNREAMPDADTSGWLEPVEIARVVGFLAGPAGAVVTGSAIRMSR